MITLDNPTLTEAGVDAGGHDAVVRSIVFTDVVGSTSVAAHEGDLELLRLLERHDRLVALNTTAWGGETVKSTGDGAMVIFDRPAFAATSAIHIQRQAITAGVPLRVGIDHGPVTRVDGGDYRGLVVNVAARLADLADEGEILLTERAARAAQLPGPTQPRPIAGLPARLRVRSLAVTRGAI